METVTGCLLPVTGASILYFREPAPGTRQLQPHEASLSIYQFAC
jgi:hypothetical protein